MKMRHFVQHDRIIINNMELEKQIQADMVAAMKEKDAVRLASVRAIKAAIMLG